MSIDSRDRSQRLACVLSDVQEALVAGCAPPADAPPALPNDLREQGQRAETCLRMLEQFRRRFVIDTPRAPGNRGGSALGPLWRLHENGGLPTDNDSGDLHIGRFQVSRLLGRGGHGMVYLAFDPMLRRDVAVKIPRPETVASDDLRRRFLRESQTMARLHHPNLVTVYEVGQTGPVCYIASQFCAGPNLAEWLKKRSGGIPIRDAARLVETLAATVEHVHRHGVLHRDIKPSNVLLEPLPDARESDDFFESDLWQFVPKLADFGLARCDSTSTAATQTGELLGTIGYMAPEQAAGRIRDVGPHTDVYSLGVVLFELIAGRTPYRGETDLNTLRQITEGRTVSLRRFRPDVSRDLEAVCAKCLEQNPQRRYRTAAELADDLGRFLAGEPVHARRPSVWRRLAAWGRREPWVAVLTTSLVLTAAIGFAAVTWQWRRAEANFELADAHRQEAERNFRQAHGVVREFHNVLYDGSKYDGPEFRALQRELLETGLKYYRGFLKSHGDDPALKADAADTLYRIAFITTSSGSKTQALRIYSESLPFWEDLARQFPDVGEYRHFLAKTHRMLAFLQNQLGRRDEAAASSAKALAVSRELVRRHHGEVDYRAELGYAFHGLCDQHVFAKRWSSVRESAEQAAACFAAAARQQPRRAEYQRMLAASYRSMADAHLGAGRPARALQDYERARRVCEALVARQLDLPNSEKTLAYVLLALGSVSHQVGNIRGSLQSIAKSREILERLVRRFPRETNYRNSLASAHQLTGILLAKTDRDSAARHLASASKLQSELQRKYPDVLVYSRNLGITNLELARLQMRTGEFDQALQNIREAVALLRKWRRKFPEDTNVLMKLCDAEFSIARLQDRKGESTEAVAAARRAARLLEKLLILVPGNNNQRTQLANVWLFLGERLQREGKSGEARSAYERGIGQLRRLGNERQFNAIQKELLKALTAGVGRSGASKSHP